MTAPFVKGDTWTRSWVLKDDLDVPIDITGVTVLLELRDVNGDASITASTEDGRITLDLPEKQINMVVPWAYTDIPSGAYEFDLRVTFPDGIRRTYDRESLAVYD